MPKFKFEATNPVVTGALTLTQIENVAAWQRIQSYFFHVHQGHGAGWPLYVANRDGKNMSKWNLFDKTADTITFEDNRSATAFEVAEAQQLLIDNFACFMAIAKKEYEIVASKAVICPKTACKGSPGRRKGGAMVCMNCGDTLG